MKYSDKAIYMVGNTNLNLIDYKMSVKIKNYLNLLFQKNFIPVINKPNGLLGNNAKITDQINKNHFLNNDMHSGIRTTDKSDHFLILLISKDLMLDSSTGPIYIKNEK